jgi:hypothetical protein
MDPRERALGAARRRQHGAFTLAQARGAGHSRDAVRRRVRNGTWQELAPRVYTVANGTVASFTLRLMACVLATGGVACGASAAWLHGLVPEPDEPEVVVARGRRRVLGGQASTDTLPPCDCTEVDGIPCTTPARTVVDLAGTLTRREAEALVDRAIARGIVRAGRLEQRARALAAPSRRGGGVVLRALECSTPSTAKARSELELVAVRACRRAGGPQPLVNHPVRCGGRRRVLDLAWPDVMVAVELDGRGPHSSRAAFEDDRSRQNDLVAAGWTVFRLTWRALHHDRARALAPILAELHRRSPRAWYREDVLGATKTRLVQPDLGLGSAISSTQRLRSRA